MNNPIAKKATISGGLLFAVNTPEFPVGVGVLLDVDSDATAACSKVVLMTVVDGA